MYQKLLKALGNTFPNCIPEHVRAILESDAESKRFAALRQVDAKHLRVEFNQNNIFKRLRGNENCFHNISRTILPTLKKPDE